MNKPLAGKAAVMHRLKPGNNKRFEVFSREEIQKKKDESIPSNTKQSNKKAARAFRAYLLECDGSARYDFENFTTSELDAALEGFWFSARTLTGEKYRASSLDNLRHGL